MDTTFANFTIDNYFDTDFTADFDFDKVFGNLNNSFSDNSNWD